MRRIRQLALASLWIPVLVLVALFATAPGGSGVGTTARAAVPTITPSFTEPLEFTHPYFPFVPGAMKVFAGLEDGDDVTVVIQHLDETRTFRWNDQDVTCSALREVDFVDGEIVGTAETYYAQSETGDIWTFGEIETSYEAGMIENHEGSWVVGEPSPEDPPGTVIGEGPGLHLVADMEVGDTWVEEDLPAARSIQRRRVLRARKRIKVPAGKFDDCTEVEEEEDEDGEHEVERKWYAPGVGVIKVRSEGEKLKLVATSLRPR